VCKHLPAPAAADLQHVALIQEGVDLHLALEQLRRARVGDDGQAVARLERHRRADVVHVVMGQEHLGGALSSGDERVEGLKERGLLVVVGGGGVYQGQRTLAQEVTVGVRGRGQGGRA
jgi:hypothetical protein